MAIHSNLMDKIVIGFFIQDYVRKSVHYTVRETSLWVLRADQVPLFGQPELNKICNFKNEKKVDTYIRTVFPINRTKLLSPS